METHITAGSAGLGRKGTLLVLPGTLPARLEVGRQGQSRTRWRARASPYRWQRPGGRAAVSGKAYCTSFILTQRLWGSPRWVCSPALVWASGPLHCAMLGAAGTSPGQGGGSWSATLPLGVPARLGRPERAQREGSLQAAPGSGSGVSVGALHPQASTEPRSPSSQRGRAGPGRAGQASEPAGWRRLVSQDGMCRMRGGHLAVPHNLSRPCPPPWALSFPLINWEQQWA